MPEPLTLEGRQAHGELCTLLECAAVQQAKSSASRRHEPEPDQPAPLVACEKEASVHLEQPRVGDKPPICSRPRWPQLRCAQRPQRTQKAHGGWSQPRLPPSTGRPLQQRGGPEPIPQTPRTMSF
jgi:hypothetical protein